MQVCDPLDILGTIPLLGKWVQASDFILNHLNKIVCLTVLCARRLVTFPTHDLAISLVLSG